MGGGGGEYSYISVLPDEFLLKLTLMTAVSKEIRRTEQEDMNIPPPPPPINALVSPLSLGNVYEQNRCAERNLQHLQKYYK